MRPLGCTSKTSVCFDNRGENRRSAKGAKIMEKTWADTLQQLQAGCGILAAMGWAERNAGNVSIRLLEEEAVSLSQEGGSICGLPQAWTPLEVPEPALGGMAFLVTATGRYLRNVPAHPEENAGVVRLNAEGTAWTPIWGYAAGAGPTSELSAHLCSHRVRMLASDGTDRVILHTHPDRLIALTYALDLDTPALTRLLWEMHAECVVVFPDGVGYLPWMMAGTKGIADATARLFETRRMVLWQWHGIFASGAILDEAIGLVETAEKAAGILLLARQAGGVVHRPDAQTLAAIAANFGQTPEPEALRDKD